MFYAFDFFSNTIHVHIAIRYTCRYLFLLAIHLLLAIPTTLASTASDGRQHQNTPPPSDTSPGWVYSTYNTAPRGWTLKQVAGQIQSPSQWCVDMYHQSKSLKDDTTVQSDWAMTVTTSHKLHLKTIKLNWCNDTLWNGTQTCSQVTHFNWRIQ